MLRRVGPLGVAIAAVQVARAVREHWQTVPEGDRARLAQLIGQSKGKPSNLSREERRELVGRIRRLRPLRLLRKSATAAALSRTRV